MLYCCIPAILMTSFCLFFSSFRFYCFAIHFSLRWFYQNYILVSGGFIRSSPDVITRKHWKDVPVQWLTCSRKLLLVFGNVGLLSKWPSYPLHPIQNYLPKWVATSDICILRQFFLTGWHVFGHTGFKTCTDMKLNLPIWQKIHVHQIK